MRHRERVDLNITDSKGLMAVDGMDCGTALVRKKSLDGTHRPMRKPNSQTMFGGKFEHAAGVVIMLVRDQDAGKLLGFQPKSGETSCRISQAKTTVHHQSRGTHFNYQRVTGTATA